MPYHRAPNKVVCREDLSTTNAATPFRRLPPAYRQQMCDCSFPPAQLLLHSASVLVHILQSVPTQSPGN